MTTVHPHACGEYDLGLRVPRHGHGSSPRVWGIQNASCVSWGCQRFIPTRVGNTTNILPKPSGTTVHPHACGEYSAARLMARCKHGSSPRVWGIQKRCRHPGRIRRFIPTRVGNTRPGWAARPATPVHPHACGEYQISTLQKDVSSGSSPRVWGIHKSVGEQGVIGRFIPTRVGNTFPRHARGGRWPVHPHACGEYSISLRSWLLGSGSSPRVWGIHMSAFGEFVFERFIPTRVGNTVNVAVIMPGCSGSSPRVWGIPDVGRHLNAFRRFIPTRVGNTPWVKREIPRRAVHPHACGEYV